MREVKISPAPHWAAIFARRPDLEAPGYQDVLAQFKEKQLDFEAQRIRDKMRQIHKEKLSTKNRNRSKKK